MSRHSFVALAAALGALFVGSLSSHQAGAAPIIAPITLPKPPPIVLPDIHHGVEYSLAPCSKYSMPKNTLPMCEYSGVAGTDYLPCFYGFSERYWLMPPQDGTWDRTFTWASGNFVKSATGAIACSAPSETGSVTVSAAPNQTLVAVHGYYETDRTKKARVTFSGSVWRSAETAPTSLVLALQAQDPTSLVWTDRATQNLPTSGYADIELIAAIEEYTELRAVVRSSGLLTKPAKPAPVLSVNDVRLFVGKCIPDTSKPGECLP